MQLDGTVAMLRGQHLRMAERRMGMSSMESHCASGRKGTFPVPASPTGISRSAPA